MAAFVADNPVLFSVGPCFISTSTRSGYLAFRRADEPVRRGRTRRTSRKSGSYHGREYAQDKCRYKVHYKYFFKHHSFHTNHLSLLNLSNQKITLPIMKIIKAGYHLRTLKNTNLRNNAIILCRSMLSLYILKKIKTIFMISKQLY